VIGPVADDEFGDTYAAQGYTVRLMSPEYVQPYVKSQKTDGRTEGPHDGGEPSPQSRHGVAKTGRAR
jgi:hypothetical protein